MKYLIIISVFAFLFSSCSDNKKFWEYKVIYYTGLNSRDGIEAFKYQSITPDDAELTKLGEQGWEIATSYLEMETAFPNFGEKAYHTGIKENVRPQRLVIILKRLKGVYSDKKK